MATTLATPRGRSAGAEAARTELLERFETIYRDASGDCSKIPWAHKRPCPSLMNWLDAVGPSVVRPGARVCVVGCGLGMDAAALAERGYEVTAFDACEAAIDSARALHPGIANSFVQMDLLDDPGKYRHRFELVVEVHTIQSMPPGEWGAMSRAICELACPRGAVVAIARGRLPEIRVEALDGPPFPLTKEEFEALFRKAGMQVIGGVDAFEDENEPPVLRLRGCFSRSGG